MRQNIAASPLIFCVFAILLSFAGCDRNPVSGSQLTRANYDKITVGMSKAQVGTYPGPADHDGRRSD